MSHYFTSLRRLKVGAQPFDRSQQTFSNLHTESLLGEPLTKSTKASRTLDCIGLFCPEPVFRTRVELDELEIGQTLEVWADDPAAEKDIESLTRRLGHEILEKRKEDDKIYFLIKKG